jgi:2-dehydro-3-deoxygalactonokinase
MPGVFISCDWGTTRLRLRAVRTDGLRVAAEHRSLDGVAALARQVAAGERAARYRAILADGINAWSARLGAELRDAPVMVSGMASSSIGWEDLPYAPLPLPLDGSRLAWRELEPLRTEPGVHRVVLISGASSATDVMRGEETEMVGLFALEAARPLAARALVIKPGTHSKHLRVEVGQIVGLQTFMTGELAEVLGRHSVLAHSIDREAAVEWLSDKVAGDFRAGVRHALELPLAAALFRVRTRQVLDNLSGASNRAFLSGVLVGSELAYLADTSLADVPLVLCATSPLDAHYCTALDELGLSGRLMVIPADEVDRLSTRGQAVLGQRLRIV